MGLFSRRVKNAAYGTAQNAAAGVAPLSSLLSFSVGAAQERALSIPTVNRSRDLIASLVGSLDLRHYTRQWTGEQYEEIYLPNEPWMDNPDPNVTRSFFMSNVFSDLFFHGIAFALVTSRRADDNRPASLQWIPANDVNVPNQVPGQYVTKPQTIYIQGQLVNPKDVVTFLSPVTAVLWEGSRALNIALHLDGAADKLASLESVPGYLQQKGGETMSGDELSTLAEGWAAMRRTGNAIGALNDYVEFVEYKNNPMEVISEQRKYQSLELARLCNIPAYLVSAPQEGTGFTYANAQQARQDLFLFGARPFLDAIQEELSMTMLPRNRFVKFNIDAYLRDNEMTSVPVEPPVGAPAQ